MRLGGGGVGWRGWVQETCIWSAITAHSERKAARSGGRRWEEFGMKLISVTSEKLPFSRSQRLSGNHDSALRLGCRQVFNIDAPPFCLRHQ